MAQPAPVAQGPRHPSPPLGVLAIVYSVLFLAGLYPVTVIAGAPSFPSPGAPPDAIVAFFRARPDAVLLCAFFHFGAAIVLGIFTATAVSRLQFLGVRAAGAFIGLFGGFAAAFTIAASSATLWAMAHPGVAQDAALTQALYWLMSAFGGSGFAMPFGLLMAGISIPSLFYKLLPKWIAILGIALAVCGELSWFNLISGRALFLVPLTRFPGMVWMIAAGFALPRSASRHLAGAAPATSLAGSRGVE